MKIRNFIFRVIAGALILPLLGVGAVPAKTACTGDCACCAGNRDGRPPENGISAEPHQVPGLQSILEGVHGRHGRVSTAYETDPDSRQGIKSGSCNMEHPRPLEVVRHSGPTVPRPERSLSGALISASVEAPPEDRLIPGQTVRYLRTVHVGPIPLYLQNLSLLF